MVFVFLEGYAFGAPSYTTCMDANSGGGMRVDGAWLAGHEADLSDPAVPTDLSDD